MKRHNSTKNDYFSFMVIPPDNRQTMTLRIKKNHLYTGLAGAVLGVCIVMFSIFYTGHTSSELAQYKKVKNKSIQQRKQIYSLSFQIEAIKKDMEALMEKEVEIRGLMQPRHREFKHGNTSSVVKEFHELYAQIQGNKSQISAENLEEQVAFLSGELRQLKTEFRTHNQKLEQFKGRFAATPSIWPIYGQIQSGFGWRMHPVSQATHFHKGIDIPSWVGAPIRATAEGRVVTAGYNNGYGLCVMIDHGHGIMTVYGHASRLMVNQGDTVKKGQRIAAVGSTGLSTGPHLHYEVRRWQEVVSPRAYLDLDMFTANKDVW